MNGPTFGQVAMISVGQIEQVIIDTLESTPLHATHWWRASMVEKSGLLQSTVDRVLEGPRAQALLEESLRFSTGPLCGGKVFRFVGLYFSRWRLRRSCGQSVRSA